MTSLIIAKKNSELAFLFSIVYEKMIVFNKIQKNGYFFSDSCDTVKKDATGMAAGNRCNLR